MHNYMFSVFLLLLLLLLTAAHKTSGQQSSSSWCVCLPPLPPTKLLFPWRQGQWGWDWTLCLCSY